MRLALSLPPAWPAEMCEAVEDTDRDRYAKQYYVPSLKLWFEQHKSLRACGDGGSDPGHWSWQPLDSAVRR